MRRRFTLAAALLTLLPFALAGFSVGRALAQNVQSFKIVVPAAEEPEEMPEPSPRPGEEYMISGVSETEDDCPICPECRRLDLEQGVVYRRTSPSPVCTVTLSPATAVPWGVYGQGMRIDTRFWDAEGAYHVHEAATHVRWYECDRGHVFSLVEVKPWCFCGWPDKGPYASVEGSSLRRRRHGKRLPLPVDWRALFRACPVSSEPFNCSPAPTR